MRPTKRIEARERANPSRKSVQGVWVDPIFILRVDIDLWHRFELALVKRRHVRLGRAESGKMGLRLFETPVIRIWRPVAPRGPVGLGGGSDGG